MYIQTKALIDEYESRLILFSIIEPGHLGWSKEIQKLGATRVLEAITQGAYNPRTCESILNRINHTNVDMLESAVNTSDSEFIYPGHSKWPHQLDQLSNPPIGLIVKGDINTLTKNRLQLLVQESQVNQG
jgi:DNA processing protein